MADFGDETEQKECDDNLFVRRKLYDDRVELYNGLRDDCELLIRKEIEQRGECVTLTEELSIANEKIEMLEKQKEATLDVINRMRVGDVAMANEIKMMRPVVAAIVDFEAVFKNLNEALMRYVATQAVARCAAEREEES